ncbi:cell division protein ZapA [Vagococcus sp. AM17-17]|nr:cell division protein ZapA [Vagococcus sp. AM17-17]
MGGFKMALEENKRYKATIAGNTYTIIGKESHYHMDIVNQLANEQLETIMKNAPKLSTEQAAILLAINTLSVQIKQQETILDLKKDISDLEDELEKMMGLEERLANIESREKEMRKKILQENRKLTDEEMLNQIEIQKIVNEQAKEKIKRNNNQKKSSINK